MKSKLLKVVNPILFIIMFIQAVSGLGQRYATSQDLFVFFRRLHGPNGMLLIILVIIHIYLNWGWIKLNVFKARPKKKQ